MAPVHEAARENDVEGLRRLLEEDPGVVEAEENYWQCSRPLHCACEEGAMEAACLLLDRGAAIDAVDISGRTPLMMACGAGRVELVSALLDRGADPELRCESWFTALMHASCEVQRDGSDHVAVIRLLLKDGRVPVDASNGEGETALWWACNLGQTEVARVLLLEGGADHTIFDEGGLTPMAIARRRARQDIVQLLEWFEGELHRAFLLSKARAVVDATESISKAPEKVGARTEAEAQRAREEAAPAWLRGRVRRGEALPSVEVQGGRRGREGNEEEEKEDEERCAVLKFVVTVLKDDLQVELMEGLRLR